MQLMSVQPSLVALGGGVGGGGGLAAPGTIGRSCSANEDITLYSTLTLLELGDVNNEDGDEARATEGAVGVGVVSGIGPRALGPAELARATELAGPCLGPPLHIMVEHPATRNAPACLAHVHGRVREHGSARA